MVSELSADRLAWRCPDHWVPWKTLSEVEAARSIVGQERAVDAIEFGLSVRGVGFNVFVTGLSGTGRLTTIKRFLDEQAGDGPAPDDVCFVFNFDCPEHPRVLRLSAGEGVKLRRAMDQMIDELRENLPEILKSPEFRKRVDFALAALKRRELELTRAFETKVKASGFQLVQIQTGPVTRPEIYVTMGEEAIPVEDLDGQVEAGALDADKVEELRKVHAALMEEMEQIFEQVSELRTQMQERVEQVQQSAIEPLLDVVVQRVRKAVTDERVGPYLDQVATDLRENTELFTGEDEADGGGDQYLRWRINVAVDNSETRGHPVLMETEPSFANVFGTIERAVGPRGEGFTDFTRIRAGSLLRADGGYLVLNMDDLAVDARVWPALKRALKYGRVQIQSPETIVYGVAALKPEEVPLDVKVVIIGDRSSYDLLYRYDRDFPKIFKVLADFDSVMKPTADNSRDVLTVLAKVAGDEGLLPLDRDGMAAMLELAVRLAGSRRRFSSRFSDLADCYREASYLAARDGREMAGRTEVRAAVEARNRRHGLSEEKTLEWIAENVIRVDTEGVAVGQVNGLAVYDLGHCRFGKPSRITARIGVGREGVINVERQAGLSGPTYDKGVQILTGYLRGTFAGTVPLTMACSITFEQSYGGVDGDSASSTEIYAILSALSGVPLRQDIAVTGSVDQLGRVQAIGGVNEKIEGFFKVCSERGLTGSQGVMIPADNVADLQLAPEVVQAVEEGRFHVWSVRTVEEGIEHLTGMPAGEPLEEGWTPDSVFDRCQRRLDEMSRLMRQAGKGGGGENSESSTTGEDSGERSGTGGQ